ncbi:DUF1697 domain-containing protein [Sunxiuqinia dokdonensis]|uniref:DUF1697 domain-containing protein n=1 Tax=Sunxiuqinia dokdonensis TaxID=1409788 RepID=A0A0L8VDK8_9BACT|nr:DUF1697 domain-containing protein [Sunxiuqinia dokdonensis]KOH46565.1 hypothetical protein NC99_07040 [Sunxiuqinia dokdonensis]
MSETYVALLRGINVGGHHKVPMAELRKTMEKMGFKKVKTLLNSGNVIFEGAFSPITDPEELVSTGLEKAFGFPIPVLIRTAEEIRELIRSQPFERVEEAKDTRLYVSFLKHDPKIQIELPWTADDGSFRILSVQQKAICSVLDLSITNTVKGMDALGQLFSKATMTTRNWKTINRIAEKLD